MLSWFQANVEHLLAASNFTIAFFMFIMGTIVAKFLFHTEFSKKTDIKIMLMGVTTLCYGLAIHRLYWGSNRVTKIFKKGEIQTFLETNGYLALLPSFVVLFGIVLVISPTLSLYIQSKVKTAGNWLHCFALVLMFALSFYWFVFFKIHEVHYTMYGELFKQETYPIQLPIDQLPEE